MTPARATARPPRADAGATTRTRRRDGRRTPIAVVGTWLAAARRAARAAGRAVVAFVAADWRRALRRTLVGTAIAAVATAAWWGPPVLSRLDYFHVREIAFDGVRYAAPDELAARLALDTTASVWAPLDPLGERIAGHPLVASARVARELPGRLVVRVEEHVPVALVERDGGLAPVAADGRVLPIDPTRAAVDLPVASADTALLALLGTLRRARPDLWRRLSAATVDAAGDLRFRFGGVTVRARRDVTAARFADILPVEAYLAGRGGTALELDVRFRDQVIARLP